MLHFSFRMLLAVACSLIIKDSCAQQGSKTLFDTHVLAKVQGSLAGDGNIADAEILYKEITSDKTLQNWVNSHTINSEKLINTAISKRKNQSKYTVPSDTYEKTKQVFFDQEFFNSVPVPDMGNEEGGRNYMETNAAFFADRKELRNQVKETLNEQGTNALFARGILPTEDDGFTQKMFLTRSSKDGTQVSVVEELHHRTVTGNTNPIPHAKVISRPLRDKAMLLEKKYWYTDDEMSYINTELEEEARFFEETIVAWSPKANFYAATEEEKNSKEAKESRPYTVARAILLRMCQQRMVELQYDFWQEKMKGMANLSAETAAVFASVNWESAAARSGDLSNPVIQMAQRAYTFDLRLDKLFFEASLLEAKSKTSFTTYGKIVDGRF